MLCMCGKGDRVHSVGAQLLDVLGVLGGVLPNVIGTGMEFLRRRPTRKRNRR